MAALSFLRRIMQTGQTQPSAQASTGPRRQANEGQISLLQRMRSTITGALSNQNDGGPESPDLSSREWIYDGHPLFTTPALSSLIASYLLGASLESPYIAFPVAKVLAYHPETTLKLCLSNRQGLTREEIFYFKEEPAFKEMQATEWFRQCPNLTHLNLNDFDLSKSSMGVDLKPYLQSMIPYRNLQSIDFPDSITMADAIELAKRYSLTSVSFRQEFTDAELEAFAKLCPNLTAINLSAQDCLTDGGLQVLAKNCPSLKTIDLLACENISDAGIEILTSLCPKLSSINLSHCEQLTDASIETISKNCAYLTSIRLAYCDQISPAAFKMLFMASPLLAIAALTDTSITDDELEVLAQNCPYLTSIEVHGCPITQAGIDALAAGCPRLTSVVKLY